MKLLKVFGLVALVGCGVDPVEKRESALATLYQTGAPCTNCSQGQSTGVTKAESTFKYSCGGWVYRLLFSWEQHPQGAGFDSNWYTKISTTSSPAQTGTVQDGVSADAYLSCAGGLYPSTSGVTPGGLAYSNRLYEDATSPNLRQLCTITTIWPSEWGLPNPVIFVYLTAYDYNPATASDAPHGYLNLGLTNLNPQPPGYGFCGSRWYGGVVTTTAKLPLPPPMAMPGTTSLPSCSTLTLSERMFIPCAMPMPAPGP